MNTLDDALKTFLVWHGVAHLCMVGYAGIVGWMLITGFLLGAALTTQQTFLVGTATGVLPVMLNWYAGVMAATKREVKQ